MHPRGWAAESRLVERLNWRGLKKLNPALTAGIQPLLTPPLFPCGNDGRYKKSPHRPSICPLHGQRFPHYYELVVRRATIHDVGDSLAGSNVPRNEDRAALAKI